jgi:hypothetical protein
LVVFTTDVRLTHHRRLSLEPLADREREACALFACARRLAKALIEA